MKIAIIGMGISGSSTLKHLFDLKALDSNDTIDIFEPRNEIGTGFAYQVDDETLLMNSYSSRLSLNEDQPREYLEWLNQHHPEYLNDDFSPRHIFGLYLRDKYEPYLKFDQVRHIKERVIDIEIKEPERLQFNIMTEQQRYSDYDFIFMTIGHPPYADYYHLNGSTNYIHNPYPLSQTLNSIDKDDRIGIIGSSLTAIDITHSLMSHHELNHPILLFSRFQPFTNVKNQLYNQPIVLTMDEEWIDQQKEVHSGYIPLELMWKQLQQDMQANGVNMMDAIHKYQVGSVSAMKIQTQDTPLDLQIIQRYVGLLTAYLPSLNMALSPADRQLFHSKYKRLFEHFRTQFPAFKMKLMHHWLENQKIKFITGLEDIKPQADGTYIVQTREGYQHPVDILINATGFDMNLSKAASMDSMISNLYRREIFMQNSLGGVQISWPKSHPLSPKYGEILNMTLSGAWIFTTQFGNNNAQMTAKHGKTMVQEFINYRKMLGK